jgi:hypothetical protein
MMLWNTEQCAMKHDVVKEATHVDVDSVKDDVGVMTADDETVPATTSCLRWP